MYVEAYETSSKRSIFSNNAFVRNVHHRSLCVVCILLNKSTVTLKRFYAVNQRAAIWFYTRADCKTSAYLSLYERASLNRGGGGLGGAVILGRDA